jgi:subtilisin
MIEEELGDKQRYIVTFEKKDRRKDTKTDKKDILRKIVDPNHKLEFVDVGNQALGFAPQDDPLNVVALDINDYEHPMVFLALTEGEADELGKDPNVDAVELDGKIYALDISPFDMPPEGELVNNLISATAEEPSAQADVIPWGVSKVRAPLCWEATKGKGIYVAVIDTGIAPHQDLSGNLLGGISFVPGQNWVDGNGHGTHVAGTIAARINGFGVVGVAPSAYLYGIKVLNNGGSGYWSWLMAGLYWMRRYYGCTFDVANMSLGASSAPSVLETYINYAAQKTLLVAAAGNCYGGSVGYPAKFEKCVAVSAIKSDNTLADFSCKGPEVDLCAPGVNILSTLPGNRYGCLSGTSMAAPHVAGAAALCRGTHRYADMDTIKGILFRTATDYPPDGRDDKFGYGLVNCYGATFSRTCG